VTSPGLPLLRLLLDPPHAGELAEHLVELARRVEEAAEVIIPGR